jgi:hypothetical protein
MLRRVWESNAGQMFIGVPKDNEDGLCAGMWVNVARAQPPAQHKRCRVCRRLYGQHTLDELVKHGLWVK